MFEWIKENINPPGITKPNRGGIFSFIGRVFGKVNEDAVKAYNAHFPYLADDDKLREHAKALSIPELLHDTPQEFRDCVATASFFLERSGERGYIMEQLEAHFGERFALDENFLELYIKILDISDADREWVHSFLDETLDPNIKLTTADWFRFLEEILANEENNIQVKRRDIDFLTGGAPLCDGSFYCDQGVEVLCDGVRLCDGSFNCDRFNSAAGTLSPIIQRSITCNGDWVCGGSIKCSGFEELERDYDVPLPILSGRGGDEFDIISISHYLGDSVNIDDGLASIKIIKPFLCDGSVTLACSLCDGSIICDGSYTFDGRYCRDEVLSEEVI